MDYYVAVSAWMTSMQYTAKNGQNAQYFNLLSAGPEIRQNAGPYSCNVIR